MGSVADGERALRASGNLLLSRLLPADQRLLAPHVDARTAEYGCVVLDAGQALDAIYFPDSACFSLEEEVGPGRMVEVAVVGREGLLGWPALLGAERSSHSAVARMRAGTLLRVELAPLRAACARSPSLRAVLLQFVHVMIVQMGQAIASQLQHSLDQRLARWLLMRHDRVGGDLLLVHHDEIADSMNVRRASVTDRLHQLEGEKLIRCRRGKVLVRDRSGLEAFAGDAYGIAEEHYRSLIAPFGKSAVAAPAV